MQCENFGAGLESKRQLSSIQAIENSGSHLGLKRAVDPHTRDVSVVPGCAEIDPFDSFFKSTDTSLCIISDQVCTRDDYQWLIDKFPMLPDVFIGSDADIHTSEDRLKSAAFVLIDYSMLFQEDALNFLLEIENGRHKKIVGIISHEKFRLSARSFQTRWNGFMEIGCGLMREGASGGEYVHHKRPLGLDHYLEIEEDYSVEMYLEDIRQDAVSICLEGGRLDSPVSRYLQACLRQMGRQVSLYQYPYPFNAVRVWSYEGLSGVSLIHSANFDEVVDGRFYIKNEQLCRKPSAKKLCVMSSLTDSQWRYLGHLEQDRDVEIFVLSNVYAPRVVNVQTTQREIVRDLRCKEQVVNLETFLRHLEKGWIVCQDNRLADVLCQIERVQDSGRCVIRLIVNPEDRLLDYFTTIIATGESTFGYSKSEMQTHFENPNATIIFENISCNQAMKLDLISFVLNPKMAIGETVIPVSAKIVCISEENPYSSCLPVVTLDHLENACSESYLTRSFSPKTIEVESLLDKSFIIVSHLEDPSVRALMLYGESFSGKSFYLNKARKGLGMKKMTILCSQVVSQGEIYALVKEWLKATEPTLLEIDCYETMPVGTWRFLMPDAHHVIYMDGKASIIPATHRCVFVGNDKVRCAEHKLDQFLVKIVFCDYSTQDYYSILRQTNTSEDIISWIREHSEIWFQMNYGNRYLALEICKDLHSTYERNASYSMKTGLSIFYKPSFYSNDNVLGIIESLLTMGQFPIAFFTWLMSSKVTNLPMLWIQGEAGCGKDYAVDEMLKVLRIPFVRVKGSNLQGVLTQEKVVNRQGGMLVIEEADLLSKDVLESMIKKCVKSAYHYKIIGTVNGTAYKGRHGLSKAILNRTCILHVKPVDSADIEFMLRRKYPKLLSEDIGLIGKRYRDCEYAISPREVFSVVNDWINTKGGDLGQCWDRKVSFLKVFHEAFYSMDTEYKHLQTVHESLMKEIELVEDHPKVKSGLEMSSQTPISGRSDHPSLVVFYYVVDKDGNQFFCSGEGGRYGCVKDGQYYLEIKDSLWDRFLVLKEGGGYLQIPLPSGCYPDVVWLGDSLSQMEMQDKERIIKDSRGLFFLKLSQYGGTFKSNLKVKYRQNADVKCFDFEFYDGYDTCNFRLPERIRSILDKRKSQKVIEILRSLEDEFHRMNYIFGESGKVGAEERRKGHEVVQKCLDAQSGRCFEFAHSFAAIVSKYLRCPVRHLLTLSVDGEFKSSSFHGGRFAFHTIVEVFIEGQWFLFDPTPSVRTRLSPSIKHGKMDRVTQCEIGNDFVEAQDINSPTLNDTTKNEQRGWTESPVKEGMAQGGVKQRSTVFDSIQRDDLMTKLLRWCHQTGHTRPSIKVGKMPSIHSQRTLNLGMYYRTHKKLYQTMQYRKDALEIDMKVLICRNSDRVIRVRRHVGDCLKRMFLSLIGWRVCPISLMEGDESAGILNALSKAEKDRYIDCLIEMGIPVYQAKEAGILRVISSNKVDWDLLIRREDVEEKQKITYFSDIVESLKTMVGDVQDINQFDFFGIRGGINLCIENEEEFAIVYDKFLEYMNRDQDRLGYVVCLSIKGVSEKLSHSLGNFVDFVVPSKLRLEQCCLPKINSTISEIVFKNMRQDRLSLEAYVHAHENIKSVTILD